MYINMNRIEELYLEIEILEHQEEEALEYDNFTKATELSFQIGKLQGELIDLLDINKISEKINEPVDFSGFGNLK